MVAQLLKHGFDLIVGGTGQKCRMAQVVPTVPGPSSTTMREWAMPAASTMRRSRKRELGMTDPIRAG